MGAPYLHQDGLHTPQPLGRYDENPIDVPSFIWLSTADLGQTGEGFPG